MFVVYGIPDLQNPAGNCPIKIFIDSQEFTVIDDFSMLRIKGVPHIIKDHNLVPNQETRVGNILQRNLEVLVWWEKDRQHLGLVIIAATWTAADLISSFTQINIESQLEKYIKWRTLLNLKQGTNRQHGTSNGRIISAPW